VVPEKNASNFINKIDGNGKVAHCSGCRRDDHAKLNFLIHFGTYRVEPVE
jgi:hypothetical protein